MKRLDYNENDTKQCSSCLTVLPISEYYKTSNPRKDGSFGFRPNCKGCDAFYKLDLYHNKGGKTKQKERSFNSLMKNYGITSLVYEEERVKQNFCCIICNQHERTQPHKRLHVDHDHITGMYRGLLCNTCNIGLGMFKDNVELLTKAIEYIDENRS